MTVPDQLKALLVDDWEFVTKEHQVVPLPRDITVSDVLDAYHEAAPRRPVGSAEADIFDEVISGIKLYFDRALGNILLYRFERQQYLEVKKRYPDVPMSQIYGPEHLLRLFGVYYCFICSFALTILTNCNNSVNASIDCADQYGSTEHLCPSRTP